MQEFFAGRSCERKRRSGVRKDSEFTPQSIIESAVVGAANGLAELQTGMGAKSAKRSVCKHSNLDPHLSGKCWLFLRLTQAGANLAHESC
jgi:hypothetical protein